MSRATDFIADSIRDRLPEGVSIYSGAEYGRGNAHKVDIQAAISMDGLDPTEWPTLCLEVRASESDNGDRTITWTVDGISSKWNGDLRGQGFPEVDESFEVLRYAGRNWKVRMAERVLVVLRELLDGEARRAIHFVKALQGKECTRNVVRFTAVESAWRIFAAERGLFFDKKDNPFQPQKDTADICISREPGPGRVSWMAIFQMIGGGIVRVRYSVQDNSFCTSDDMRVTADLMDVTDAAVKVAAGAVAV